MSDLPREWQVPNAEASEKTRLGWLNSSTEQGEAWQQSQRSYSEYRKSLDILSGTDPEKEFLNYRSRIGGKRLKTNIRVAIAGLSNIRPLWGFSAGKDFNDYAMMLNKTS